MEEEGRNTAIRINYSSHLFFSTEEISFQGGVHNLNSYKNVNTDVKKVVLDNTKLLLFGSEMDNCIFLNIIYQFAMYLFIVSIFTVISGQILQYQFLSSPIILSIISES